MSGNPKGLTTGAYDFMLTDVRVYDAEGNIQSEGEHSVVLSYRDVRFLEVVELGAGLTKPLDE